MPVLSLADVLSYHRQMQATGERLVLTNGVFDLVHIGHVSYLEQARSLGDRLLVALNSDRSVQAIKGPLRPIVPEGDRAAVLAALRCVDAVFIFDQPTAVGVVETVRPEIYVKGADYAAADGAPDLDRLPEARAALAYGGVVHLLPYQPGKSTSALIERILTSHRMHNS